MGTRPFWDLVAPSAHRAEHITTPIGPMHQGGILQAALAAAKAGDAEALHQHLTWCALLTGRTRAAMIEALDGLICHEAALETLVGAPRTQLDRTPLDERLEASDAWRLGAAAQWVLRTSAASLTGRPAGAFATGSLLDVGTLVASIAQHGALEVQIARGWFDLTRRFLKMAGITRDHPVVLGDYELAAIAFSLVPHEERVLRVAAAVVLGGDHAEQLRSLRELAGEIVGLDPMPETGRLWLAALLGGA